MTTPSHKPPFALDLPHIKLNLNSGPMNCTDGFGIGLAGRRGMISRVLGVLNKVVRSEGLSSMNIVHWPNVSQRRPASKEEGGERGEAGSLRSGRT